MPCSASVSPRSDASQCSASAALVGFIVVSVLLKLSGRRRERVRTWSPGRLGAVARPRRPGKHQGVLPGRGAARPAIVGTMETTEVKSDDDVIVLGRSG